jgi:methylenetetrahydrofolate dehydrogenase (NADP+)/methenyltetrahydrofolate cyclohydrolase
MPLPKQIDYKIISSFIAPEKDAEGMHPANLGKVLLGKAKIIPCTAKSAFTLVKSTGVKLYGKEVVVVGHGEIAGKPLSLLFLEEFATTTVCHIGTSEAGKLVEHVKRAEILVVAVGKAGLIKGEWIKDGAIVIDVGINRVEGKVVGDVEFEEAEKRASWITPVPGGVGPLTVTMLMQNLIEATKLQQ